MQSPAQTSFAWVWKYLPFVVALVAIAATLILRAGKNANKESPRDDDHAQKGSTEENTAAKAAAKQQQTVSDKLEKLAKRTETSQNAYVFAFRYFKQ